jgi:molecular chaperone GrpE (heat shock protein)
MSNNEERNDDIDIELEDEIVEEEGRTDKMKDKRERLKACEQESKTNLDGWQRARADYANLQKSFVQRFELMILVTGFLRRQS